MYKKMDSLEIFLENSSEWFHIRELAKILKISPMTARKYLTMLAKDKLLISKEERNLLLFKANLENQFFKNYKIFYNTRKILNSGLIDFLNEKLLYPVIVMYGSVAKGEDSEKSDIDLFVISEIKKDIDLKEFEKKIKRPVHVMIVDKEEFKNMKTKNRELLNNIVNGFVLSGYLEIF